MLAGCWMLPAICILLPEILCAFCILLLSEDFSSKTERLSFPTCNCINFLSTLTLTVCVIAYVCVSSLPMHAALFVHFYWKVANWQSWAGFSL